jgi:hypothetical protein
VKEARFALVEALRVERIAQVQERVVEMVADLVQQRAEEGPERDHLPRFAVSIHTVIVSRPRPFAGV